MKKKILGFIPARGGSRGIPRKNLVLVEGIPLLGHTINASLQAEEIDRTVVSTEDEEIAAAAKAFQADVVPRSAELADDHAQIEPAMVEALAFLEREEGYIPHAVVLLQPTSPLRRAGHIDGAMKVFHESEADSLLSVYPFPYFLWKKEGPWAVPLNYDFSNRPRHQDMAQFRENGAIYITKTALLQQTACRLGGKIALYVMEEERSLEIDTPHQLERVRELFQKGEEREYISLHGQK